MSYAHNENVNQEAVWFDKMEEVELFRNLGCLYCLSAAWHHQWWFTVFQKVPVPILWSLKPNVLTVDHHLYEGNCLVINVYNFDFSKLTIAECTIIFGVCEAWPFHGSQGEGTFSLEVQCPLSPLLRLANITVCRPRLQQWRGSNHWVGCFCALPGCASTTLISQIYRTPCIQSTHLLRTSARQNHSLLIAVVAEIERTAECGGGKGVWKGRTGKKKTFHSNVQDSSREKSLWALPHLHRKSNYLSDVIYSFPFFHSIHPLEAWMTHLENEPQKVTNWLFNHSRWDNKPYVLHLPAWQVWKCELYKY